MRVVGRRIAAWCCAIVLVLGIGAQTAAQTPGRFDPAPWIEDVHQLEHEMSSQYANLDAAITERRMDLPELANRTDERLRTADSPAAAQRVIEAFLREFGDGGLAIQWERRWHTTPVGWPTMCAQIGYRPRASLGIAFDRLPGFTAKRIASGEFPVWLVHLPHNRTIGVLRIGLFSAYEHPALCEAALAELNIDPHGACDQRCEDLVGSDVTTRLTRALAQSVRAIAAAGARTLLVDVTSNGDGGGWVEPAARTLTAHRLHSPALGFVRHEHWVNELKRRLAVIDADIAAHRQPAVLLQRAHDVLTSAVAAASTPCDLTGVWTLATAAPCHLTVGNLLFSSGVLAYAAPGSLPDIPSRDVLFSPSAYTYAEGANAMRLYILVDRNTLSSAEDFAAMLKDNGAATIVGDVTGGAGCGFTSGGIPVTLARSGAEVRIPDCARYRRDGSNEVAGVTPDILLGWTDHDSPWQRVRKLATWIATLPSDPPKQSPAATSRSERRRDRRLNIHARAGAR